MSPASTNRSNEASGLRHLISMWTPQKTVENAKNYRLKIYFFKLNQPCFISITPPFHFAFQGNGRARRTRPEESPASSAIFPGKGANPLISAMQSDGEGTPENVLARRLLYSLQKDKNNTEIQNEYAYIQYGSRPVLRTQGFLRRFR